MIKILLLVVFAVHCKASSYGYEGSYGSYGPIPAAIYTKYSSRTVDVDTPLVKVPAETVDIDSGELPLNLNFQSRSSRIRATQSNIGQPGSSQYDSSTDEPIRLSYEIVRPVNQEVREIVVPTRSIVQEVRPIEERVQRVTSRGRGVGFTGVLAPKYLG